MAKNNTSEYARKILEKWQVREKLWKTNLRNKYKSKAINRFEWKGLKELGIPAWVPEEQLYEGNRMTIFKLKGTEKIYCLPVSVDGIIMDSYGRPVEWKAVPSGNDNFRTQIISQKLNEDNAVMIYDNVNRVNTSLIVETEIDEIVNIIATMRMNMNAQKNPMTIKTSENAVLNDINMYVEFIENIPVKFTVNDLQGVTEFFNSNIPYMANEMRKTWMDWDSDILQFLGINNIPIEKNERINLDEARSNHDELTIDQRNYMIPRLEACEKIKKVLNVDVSCKFISSGTEKSFTNNGKKVTKEKESEENGS